MANSPARAPADRLTPVSETPFGKWRREYLIDPLLYLRGKVHWRNYEAGYDVAELEPPSRKHRTYVLQEYFVPVEELENFVPRMQEILRRHRVNALNISIRHAMPDTVSSGARCYMDGICLHPPGIAVPSDGYRLARRRLSVLLPPDIRAIIPRAACTALQPLLRGLSGTVRVCLAPSWIAFASAGWTYRSKLVDGEYPAYARALPERVPDPSTAKPVGSRGAADERIVRRGRPAGRPRP